MNVKQQRLQKVNQLIHQIASVGEQFFLYRGYFDRFILDSRNRVWFETGYPGMRIFAQDPTAWKKAGLGGTLTDLCRDFYQFIASGQKVPAHRFGPWPEWMSGGDPWGYGEDMEKVRVLAKELGIIE